VAACGEGLLDLPERGVVDDRWVRDLFGDDPLVGGIPAAQKEFGEDPMSTTLEDLAATIHPHPTLSEQYGEVAHLASGAPTPGGTDYRPVHTGSRFSANACTPSVASRLYLRRSSQV
jgi:hypothetical protein